MVSLRHSPNWLLSLSLLAATAVAESNPPMPEVQIGQIPMYPVVARLAEIEGDVRLKVTTDGSTIVGIKVESGQPILVRAAEDNLRTWKFAPHKPTDFSTVFSFRLDKESWTDCGSYRADNGQVVLKLPTEVLITAHIELRSMCDPSQGLDLSEPLKVFLTACEVNGRPVACERFKISLYMGSKAAMPERFKDSKERQGFIVPKEFRSQQNFGVSVDTGHGIFNMNEIDKGFLKGMWHLGIDHHPFKEDTALYNVPEDIHCAGFIEFEWGEPEVVISAPCKVNGLTTRWPLPGSPAAGNTASP